MFRGTVPNRFYSGQQRMRPLHNVCTRSLYHIMFNIIIVYILTCTHTHIHIHVRTQHIIMYVIIIYSTRLATPSTRNNGKRIPINARALASLTSIHLHRAPCTRVRQQKTFSFTCASFLHLTATAWDYPGVTWPLLTTKIQWTDVEKLIYYI